MSNKTPYEVRLEILSMAKDYLDQIRNCQLDFARAGFEKSVELGKATMDQWQSFMPQQYSIADVMKHANELYSFINKKD
jgi:hypothetical protein